MIFDSEEVGKWEFHGEGRRRQCGLRGAPLPAYGKGEAERRGRGERGVVWEATGARNR